MNNPPLDDLFLTRIRCIILDSAANQTGDGFRSEVVSEVRAYSQAIDDNTEVSEVFLKLCDLMLDCTSEAIPAITFKLIVANLVYEYSYSKAASEEELREFTGMSGQELSQAGEALKEMDYRSSDFGNIRTIEWGKKTRKKKGPFLLE